MILKKNDFYNNLSIRHKLGFCYLIIGLINSAFISMYFYNTMKESLIERTLNQLSSIKTLKKEWITDYLNNQKKELHYFSTQSETQNNFDEIYTEFLRNGSKSLNYKSLDSSVKNSIDVFKLHHKYLNIWFISKNGEIFYTSKSNMYRNKNIFKDSSFSNEFVTNCKKGLENMVIFDCEKILQNDTISYVFVASPIYKNKEIKGVILAKINPLEIQNILSQHTGMGNTGESYLVDTRNKMRSKSRFIMPSQKAIIVNTLASKKSLALVEGNEIIKDYRNIDVLSSYTYLKIDNLKWALISEIDLGEAMMPINKLKNQMIWVVILSLFLIVGTTIYFSDKIINSISKLNAEIKNLLLGKNPINRLSVENNDEIGEMNQNINALFDRLNDTAKFAQEIGKGNFDASYLPASEEDKMGNSLVDMKDKLVALTRIIAQENKKKTLSIIQGQENERRRISMELHDGVAQMLVALRFKTQELEIPSSDILELKTRIDAVLQEIKRISINLMPNVLWDVGLEAAIKTLVKHNNIPVEVFFEDTNMTSHLPNEVKFSIYRIIQEALNNIAKHAKASLITINFSCIKNKLLMEITDNGIGFDIQMIKNKDWILKDGIRNMKDRTQIINGNFSIKSVENFGTTILIEIPLTKI